MTEAYCVKCKSKVSIKDPRSIVMKNGRNAISGICPSCGTKVFRITGYKTEPVESKSGNGIRILK